MLETSLHSPRHSRIIRNTYGTLTGTPQGRSCFSKAPMLLVPWCDRRYALCAHAHTCPLKSLPPSASWYGVWLTLKQGQGVFRHQEQKAPPGAPELRHGSEGASVLAGGPRQGTEVLTRDDRLLRGMVEDGAPAIGPQGQEPSEDLPSAHPDSPGARHRPEAESGESWQGPEEGRWCVVCVCVWEGVRHTGSQDPTVHPAPTTVAPPGAPRGLHFDSGVKGLSPWDPVKHEVHLASCLEH